MEQPTFTAAQLRELGVHPNTQRSMVDDGRLRRLRRGVYTYGEEVDEATTHRELIAATRHTVDTSNVVSHTSAALLYGLPVRRSALDQVTMTRLTSGHGDAGPQLRVRNTRILPFEITELEGMPITTLARTVADVARLEPMAWGVAAIDAALHQGLEVAEVFEILGIHRRLAGVAQARAVAALADPRSESALESLSRFNMRVAGLPTPQLQVEHFDDDGVLVARSDFFWEEFGVAGECHGKHKFTELLQDGETTEAAIEKALQRGQAMRQLGIQDVNWTWNTALSPAKLAALLTPFLR